MLLDTYLNTLRKVVDSFKKSTQKALYKNESFVLRELRAHSPQDTGYFASRWRARRVRFGGTTLLAGLVMSNDTPNYGQFLEVGAGVSKAPWYFPNKKGKADTGKLMISGGKVWAGGLDPGHFKTVGGAITNMLDNKRLLNKLTVDVSNSTIKAFL